MNQPEQLAFPGVPIEPRTSKPRTTGITMMIEWGLPLRAQADVLELCGPIIDLAKVAVGISALLPEPLLRRKTDLYRQHQAEPFPGGMYLEYAFAKDAVDAYFDGCIAAGYRYVEVSNNAIPLSRTDKDKLIASARSRGFMVLGEAGSKHTVSDAGALVEDVAACLEAGSWKVFVEAAELVEHGRIRMDLLEAISSEVGMADVIWELPGAWIPGTHAHEIHALEVWLVEHVGPEVNIANVPVDGLLSLETLRRGIGVRTLVGETHK